MGVLLTVADDVTIAGLADMLDLTHLDLPVLMQAVAEYDEERVGLHGTRLRMIEGGQDHRRGPRSYSARNVPTDPALVAALAPLALAIHGPLPTDVSQQTDTALQAEVLTELATMARRRNRNLTQLLSRQDASEPLVTAANEAVRRTGRRAFQLRKTGIATRVEPCHIPAYLWEEHAGPFLGAFVGTGTRPDSVRKFASLSIVVALTGDTYRDAAMRLGHDPETTSRLAPALAARLAAAGTWRTFHADIESLIHRVADGPLVDYSQRRRDYRDLVTVPDEVLRPVGLPVTAVRRKNAAAWLWAELTGGHPWDAPAWGAPPATVNQRTVYKVFLRDYFPHAEEVLTTYRDSLAPDPRRSRPAATVGDSRRCLGARHPYGTSPMARRTNRE